MPTFSANDLKTGGIAAIESALAQSRADVAAGRWVAESAQAHGARLEAMWAADEAGDAAATQPNS